MGLANITQTEVTSALVGDYFSCGLDASVRKQRGENIKGSRMMYSLQDWHNNSISIHILINRINTLSVLVFSFCLLRSNKDIEHCKGLSFKDY